MHAVSACKMTTIRTSKGVKIVMHLHHIAIFRFNISIQISFCLQLVQILSVTFLKLSEFLKNLKKLMCVCLN